MFSRAVRWPVLRRRSTASGRAASSVTAWRVDDLGEVGADAVEVDACRSTAASAPSTSASSMSEQRCALEDGVAGGDARPARTRPPASAAMTCSIFIASMTSELLARADEVAGRDVDGDDRALQRRARRAPAPSSSGRRASSAGAGGSRGLAVVRARRAGRGVDLAPASLRGRRVAARPAGRGRSARSSGAGWPSAPARARRCARRRTGVWTRPRANVRVLRATRCEEARCWCATPSMRNSASARSARASGVGEGWRGRVRR